MVFNSSRLRYATEEKPFRSGFVYNNLHYALASDIIAKIANKPFTQLVIVNCDRDLTIRISL